MGRFAVIMVHQLYGKQDTMHSFASVAAAKKFAIKELDSVSHLKGGHGFEIVDLKTRNVVEKFGHGNVRVL